MKNILTASLTILIAAVVLTPDVVHAQTKGGTMVRDNFLFDVAFHRVNNLMEETRNMRLARQVGSATEKLAIGEMMEFEIAVPPGKSMLIAYCEDACDGVEIAALLKDSGILENSPDAPENTSLVPVNNGTSDYVGVMASVRIKACDGEHCWASFQVYSERYPDTVSVRVGASDRPD